MRTLSIAIAFLVISCGKGTEESATGKAVTPAEADTAGEPTPVEPTVDPAAARCRAILAASWTAIQPALSMVGADPTELEARYLGDSGYVERCQTLTDEQRGCLETSANPVLAIHTCRVNEGREMNQQLWSPSIDSLAQPTALAPEEGQKILDSLAGTWVSDWKSFGQVTTWVIDTDGSVTETKERGDQTETARYGLAFEHAGRIKVQTSPSSTQTYSFFRADPRTFYSGNNLAYGIHPIADEKRFTLASGGSWLVFEPGACTAISQRAETAAATCTWGKKDRARTFSVEYPVPGRTRPDGKPMTQQNTYHLIAGALLDERLVDIGTFKKK